MSEAEVPVSTVPIPDEAWQAIYDQNVWDIASALEIAAPFVARAAQVQVLREMAEELGVEIARKWDNWTELTRMQERLRERADELEGGQR